MLCSGQPRFVLLGVHNKQENIPTNDHSLQFNVAQHIPYPEYRSSSNYDDIALVRLNRPVVFSQYIRPACLPKSAVTGTRKAIATGWGQVEYEGASSNSLLKVTLELFQYAECNATYKTNVNRRLRNGIIDQTQVCAGSHSDINDTCQVSLNIVSK